MATIVLPTRTDVPHYSFEIDLEQVTFEFEFFWNDRTEAWFISIKNVDGVELLSGRRVVLDLPLLGRFRDARLPAGHIVAVDTSNTRLDPGFDELGTRVRLLYYDLADVPPEFVS